MLARVREQLSSAGFKRYFFNTSWMMAEQALRLISGLFVGIYVARFLGPEQFGIYSYALAFVSIFGVIAKLGLDGIVVRELVNAPEERDQLLGTAFWLKVLGALLSIALVLAVLPWSSNDTVTNIYILIIASGLVLQSFEVVDFYYQSLVQVKYISICKTIQLIISASVKLYFVYIGADLLFFVIVTLLDQVMLSFAYAFLARLHKFTHVFFNFSFYKAKSLLTDSWPLILSGITVMLYMRIDQVMIKEMLGSEQVGVYSAAVRLSEAWYFVPVLITISVFPAIIEAKKKSLSLYYSRLKNLYSMMIFLGLSVGILTTVFAEYIVVGLYGVVFEGASSILRINIWAGLFVAIGVANSKWFLVENKVKISLYNTAISAALNIVLNFFFIPMFGIVGAAYSTLICYFLSAYLLLFFRVTTRDSFYLITKACLFFKL